MKQCISVGTLLAFIIGGVLLLFLMLQKLAPLLVLLLIAIVITTGIDPIVHRLQHLFTPRWRMPRGVAALIVLLVALLVFVSAVSFLVMTAVNQAMTFAQNRTEIYTWLANLSHRYHFLPNLDTVVQQLRTQSKEIAGYLMTTSIALFSLLGSLFSAFIVLVLAFFFTTFKDGITHTITQFIPPAHQPRFREIGHLVAEKMGGWLRGQTTLALIITLAVALIMTASGHYEYAILVGIIGGIGELIPMVGPYLAFIPALGIALYGGHPWQIIFVIVAFITLSQIEAYVLAPKIMQRNVGLHPVTTIISLFIGGSLLGIVGALLAIPLAAGGRVILLEAVFPAIQGKTRDEIEMTSPEHQEPVPAEPAKEMQPAEK